MEVEMKRLLVLIPLFLFMYCNSGTSPTDNHDLSVSFTITDTSGVQVTAFHTGSSFDMNFNVTNLTGNTLTYGYTGVPVVFQILLADTVFASSIDYFTFPQVVLTGKIENQATYSAKWRAPSTKARQVIFTLPVGQYKARILHGSFFNEFKMDETPPILFTIIS
jgi:hypothetical protein